MAVLKPKTLQYPQIKQILDNLRAIKGRIEDGTSQNLESDQNQFNRLAASFGPQVGAFLTENSGDPFFDSLRSDVEGLGITIPSGTGPSGDNQAGGVVSPKPPPVNKPSIPIPDVAFPTPEDPNLRLPGPKITLDSDRGQTELEAGREAQQSREALQEITAKRKANIADLANLLTTNAANQFQRSVPHIAEDANSAGIFRSTGYGEALARRQGELQQDVASQLGLAGINASDLEAAGMQDIVNNRLGLQQSGLQRQFSLEDFKRQADLAREIGATSVPQVGNGKGSGALGGAATGAGIGSKFGPWGGVIGGVAGAVTGGRVSKGK